MIVTAERLAGVEAGLAEVCGELNAAHGRLVGWVAEALASGCWEGAGIHSCEQWVAWQTGLSPGRARQVVQIARRWGELPETVAALAAGELSVDQVAVVARHAPAGIDAEVATFARSATVSQLRRTLSRYAFDEPEPTTPDERPDPCYVSGMFEDNGRYRLRAALDADGGAVFDAALREAHDRLFHAGEPEVTWADALVDVAQRSLGTVESPARREAFRAIFHVHTDSTHAVWHAGPVVPPALRRELLCDADGMVVGIRGGRPVDVGRTTRVVSLALRRLVEERDRGCRVPGCTRSRVQLHHVLHWEDGGPTNSSNLMALCHRHHRMHHRGLLGISGDVDRPDGLVFTDARGRPLAGTPPTPPPANHRHHAPGRWAHPTGERLQSLWISFNGARPRARSLTVPDGPRRPPGTAGPGP
jgi:Domain of unknown function (DUF222)/HNH endonuclease